MPRLQSLLARQDVVASLEYFGSRPDEAATRDALEEQLANVPIDAPGDVIDVLLTHGLLAPFGDRLGLTTKGHRTSLLLEALDGGDLEDVFRRLRRLTGQPEMYQLVREGMTSTFIRSLVERPGFQRLFICSPWINPNVKDAAILRHVVLTAMRQQPGSPEVLVVSRPRDEMPPGAENGLSVFRELGAQIWYNRRLHSKLYIREPDRRGGAPMAIVGSQNLTRSTHFELGIRINGDSRLIDQLIRYFLELTSRSSETDPSAE